MSSNKPSIPKGTRDFGPAQMSKRNYIIETIKRSFDLFGFSEIQTPSMENLSVLTGKYGDEGDQLIFKILNSGDFLKKTHSHDLENAKELLPKISEKGLRYDLTVPFARFVVQNQNDITFPFRRYQIQPVWRADRPQKGRYREFYQCDADIIGSPGMINEVELTQLISKVFKDLNYHQYVIKVNHREVLFGLAGYVGLKGREIEFATIIDKLDKVEKNTVRQELVALGALEANLDNYFEIISEQNSPEKLINKIETILGENSGLDELHEFLDYISKSKVDINLDIDFSLARGLSYYTGMIFEVKSLDVNIGSICGGGRYDNLTGVFGLNDISGVGISFGLDRIMDVLEEKNLYPDFVQNKIDLIIGHFDKESFDHGFEMANTLRSEGIKVFLYPDLCKIKKQLNFANKTQASNTLVIGSEEIKSKRYRLKNMQTGVQEDVTIKELIEKLKRN